MIWPLPTLSSNTLDYFMHYLKLSHGTSDTFLCMCSCGPLIVPDSGIIGTVLSLLTKYIKVEE